MRRVFAVLLALSSVSLFAADQDGGTKFAIAIEQHDADAVRELLSDGLSTETTIDYGEHKITPLMKAAWDGDEAIVETLLAAGAKVNAKAADTGFAKAAYWDDALGSLGVGPTVTAVAYDNGGMTNAARVWFILQYYGLKAVILNGGWPVLASAIGLLPAASASRAPAPT